MALWRLRWHGSAANHVSPFVWVFNEAQQGRWDGGIDGGGQGRFAPPRGVIWRTRSNGAGRCSGIKRLVSFKILAAQGFELMGLFARGTLLLRHWFSFAVPD